MTAIAASPLGDTVAVGGANGELLILRVSFGGNLLAFEAGHRMAIESISIHPDNSSIATRGTDGSIIYRSLDEPFATLAVARGVTDTTWASTTFFGSSSYLMGTDEGTLVIYDSSSGDILRQTDYSVDSRVTAVAFSEIANLIASGDDRGRLQLWDARTLSPIRLPFSAHNQMVTSVAFDANGSRLVTGGVDSTVRLWDTTTGAQIGPDFLVRDRRAFVTSVAFSPDGTLFASGDVFDVLQIWNNLPPGNILQVACRYLPHINGRPDTSTVGLAAEIGIEGLTLPEDCDTYDPPLPPEFRR